MINATKLIFGISILSLFFLVSCNVGFSEKEQKQYEEELKKEQIKERHQKLSFFIKNKEKLISQSKKIREVVSAKINARKVLADEDYLHKNDIQFVSIYDRGLNTMVDTTNPAIPTYLCVKDNNTEDYLAEVNIILAHDSSYLDSTFMKLDMVLFNNILNLKYLFMCEEISALSPRGIMVDVFNQGYSKLQFFGGNSINKVTCFKLKEKIIPFYTFHFFSTNSDVVSGETYEDAIDDLKYNVRKNLHSNLQKHFKVLK